jgi:hypothetical protein
MIDCVSWGSYSAGSTDQGGNATGTPFNQATGLVPGQSMTRKVTGGPRPAKLDEADDTNDSAADFESASPSPTPNTTTTPSPGPSGEPSVERHARTITLKLSGRLDASGRVEVRDDFDRCRARVPVAVQRRRGGKWTPVKTTTTNGRGLYDVHLPNAPGTYRAKATPHAATDSDECLGATSKTAHNG